MTTVTLRREDNEYTVMVEEIRPHVFVAHLRTEHLDIRTRGASVRSAMHRLIDTLDQIETREGLRD